MINSADLNISWRDSDGARFYGIFKSLFFAKVNRQRFIFCRSIVTCLLSFKNNYPHIINYFRDGWPHFQARRWSERHRFLCWGSGCYICCELYLGADPNLLSRDCHWSRVKNFQATLGCLHYILWVTNPPMSWNHVGRKESWVHCIFWAHLCSCTVGSYALRLSVCLSCQKNQTRWKFTGQ